MPFHKGMTKTAGRQLGTPNKGAQSLKAAFQKHEKALVKALLALTKSDDENVRVKAIQACLDRGWGRVVQTVELPDAPSVVAIERIIIHTPAPGNGHDGPTLEHATLLPPHDVDDSGTEG